MSAKPKIKVLDRQFALLNLFLSDHSSWGLAELTRASGLPKSTVHRLVSVLCAHELLWQDPQDERYTGSADLPCAWDSGLWPSVTCAGSPGRSSMSSPPRSARR